MTLTALLKPVLLSINSLSHFQSICLSLVFAASACCGTGNSGKLTGALSLGIVIPRVSDSEQGVGGARHLHIATRPSNCLAFGYHQGYRMYWVQSGGSQSAR